MKFLIKDFFSKCDFFFTFTEEILMENFIFCDMAILQIALGMNYHSRHVETSYTIFLFAVWLSHSQP